MSQPSNKTTIQEIVKLFNIKREQMNKSNTPIEFEIRMDKKLIKKSEYENIFKVLYHHGFKINKTDYQLKIQPLLSQRDTSIDPRSYRIEIHSLPYIQSYCQTEELPNEPHCIHVQKTSLFTKNEKQHSESDTIKNDDYGFRSSIQKEEQLSNQNTIVKNIISNWKNLKKGYRYLHRTSLKHPNFPNLRVDMSEVRMQQKKTTNFNDSGVLQSPVSYEVEIEILNNISSISSEKYEALSDIVYRKKNEVHYNNDIWMIDSIDDANIILKKPKNKLNNDDNEYDYEYVTSENITHVDEELKKSKIDLINTEELEENTTTTNLKTTIKYILSGIQHTPYPVPFTTLNRVLVEYLDIVQKKLDFPSKKNKDAPYIKSSRHFIGPSSYALQKTNLLPKDNEYNISNVSITENFCVTDKADGERKLLFFSKDKKAYFIDTNLNVQYTGIDIMNSTNLTGTIIDGEHLEKDKYGNRINIYAAFDIYMYLNNDVRKRPFKKDDNVDEKSSHEDRYSCLYNAVNIIRTCEKRNIPNAYPLNVTTKEFIFSSNNKSIFKCCDIILKYIKGNKYPYNTDGIIFTSKNLHVNQEGKEDKQNKKGKYTWGHSFKWKPPEYNTIDFLMKIKKNSLGESKIQQKLINGKIHKYYVVHLFVGYNPEKHGNLNSQEKILYMDYGNTKKVKQDKKHAYRPIEFVPSNPYDRTAYICHIPIHYDSQGKIVMFTEEHELIEDDTIVEFRYEKDDSDKYNNWIPLRVRYDKTSDYRTNKSNFGNAYHVANSNWQTIHNPISEKMLTQEVRPEQIYESYSINDQYYNRTTQKSKTMALRNFHNKFVKEVLINSVSSNQSETTLIDMAVGKGGDLPKWIKSRLKGVLGIDIAYDNIHNTIDGACSRYIDSHEEYKKMPICMFIRGDTGKRMENGDFDIRDSKNDESNESNEYNPNIPSSYDILKSLMGENINKKNTPFLSKYHGIFRDKFDVCSIQFAIHYMFESKTKLHNFLTNVATYTKKGKYFIGTCYDGKKIYNLLKDKQIGETVEEYYKEKEDKNRETSKNATKIWHIRKGYEDNNDIFLEDLDSCIGYKVSVYQETINQEFDEYLVNFDYFVKIMEDYGFVLASKPKIINNSKSVEINAIDSFESLFNIMKSNNKSQDDEKYLKKYGLAHNMTEKEKNISFLNNYFIFQKKRDINKNVLERNIEIDYSIGKAVKTNQKIILT